MSEVKTNLSANQQDETQSPQQVSTSQLNEAIQELKRQLREYEYAGMHHLKYLL